MLSTISEMDPVLIAAAVIPAVILLLQVYRADRLEKEPTGLLISLLVFGVIATALAIVTETIGENILLSFFDETDLGYLILSNFIVVALSEEGFKLLLLRWRTWRSPNFNCQFDGVVYAVFVSLGFALWENIGYVAMYGFGTALVRAVTARCRATPASAFSWASGTARRGATRTRAILSASACAAAGHCGCPC